MMKKAFASVTALLAVSAMMIPAAVGAFDTPTINESPATVLTGTDIKSSIGIELNKDIVLFNVDGASILAPNITYKYEITSATGTNTIETYASSDLDSNGNPNSGATPITVTVKPGEIGAISTSVGDIASTAEIREGTITFGTDNETKYATNDEYVESTNAEIDVTKKVRNNLTITVDANKIYDPDYGKDGHTNVQVNGPGVYRYKISDVTDAATYKASGVTDGGAANDLYLDVYTRYTYDTSVDPKKPNGLEVYGYVLMTANESIVYDGSKKESYKVTGYDTDSEDKDLDTPVDGIQPDELKSDTYHTYNVEVQKKTEGDLADAQNNFPFTINLTNSAGVTSLDDFYYEITKDGQKISARTTSLGTGKLTDTEFGAALDADGEWALNGNTASTNLQLQNGDKILITGLPVGAQIVVKETNNTKDTYSVSAHINGTDDEAAVDVKIGEEGTPAKSLSAAKDAEVELAAAANVNKTDSRDVIVFTNTLRDISVTGLLFSIAPFAFITIAGIALLGLFMRNKKDEASENRI